MGSEKKRRIKHAEQLAKLGAKAPRMQEIPRRRNGKALEEIDKAVKAAEFAPYEDSTKNDESPNHPNAGPKRVSAGGAAAKGGGGNSPGKGSKGRT